MSVTWRQLREITSQMTRDQLDQALLIFDSNGGYWVDGRELNTMTQDDVAAYEAEHGPNPSVQVGTPYLTTQD
jgi:hypothetical protein